MTTWASTISRGPLGVRPPADKSLRYQCGWTAASFALHRGEGPADMGEYPVTDADRLALAQALREVARG